MSIEDGQGDYLVALLRVGDDTFTLFTGEPAQDANLKAIHQLQTRAQAIADALGLPLLVGDEIEELLEAEEY